MIANRCQVIADRGHIIACRSQVSSNSMVDITIINSIQKNSTDTGEWYKYKKTISVRIQKNDTVRKIV